ncbi:MAG: hypothetical protein ABIJ47_05850 [Candidatus Bathyarchaeota archaeon]
MIGDRFRMDDLEVVCVSLFFGSAIHMTVYILLTQILAEVSRPLFLSVLTGLSLCSYLLHIKYRRKSVENGASFMGKVLDVFAAYLSALTGFYLIIRVIPKLYWRGPDAWETASVVRTIVLRSLDPGEAISYFYGYVYLWNAGFYYYLSAVQLIANASVENLLRYGGAFSAGALCLLTFIVVRRMAGSFAGFLSGLLLFSNPMYLTRFVTPLREDYGFVLLILALFFFKVREDLEAQRPNVLYVSVMGFIFASSVVVHLLPSLFLFMVPMLHTLYYWLKKETTLMMENIYILLASCVFISYYVIYLGESLAWFIGVVIEGGVFLLLIPMLSVVFMWYALRNVQNPEVEHYRKLGVLLSLLVIFINLFFTSEKSGGFRALSLDMFSGVILLIGLYELLANLGKVPLFVSSIVMVTGFFIAFSYVGVVVPIERFSIYLSWVAIYLCASFLSRLISVNWVHVSSLREIGQLRNMRPEVLFLVVLVLTTSLGGALQTPRYPYYFDEVEISDTRVFNTRVRAYDLVIPQETLRHLLYYTETSYGSLVTGKDYREWLTGAYSADSPGELSDLIESRFPDKTRAVFFTTTNRYNVYDDKFVNRSILENYCREYYVGHVRYFTMDVPYVRNNVPVEKIRNVIVDYDNPFITVVDAVGAEAVTSISNVYVDHENRYRMLYTTEEGLWSAVSVAGVTWVHDGTRLLDGCFLNPYLIESGDRYHLFIEDLSGGTVAYYVSEDAYQWDRRGDLSGPLSDHLFYSAEAPVAWVEDGVMRVLFWETVVTEGVPRSGLRCLESSDGVSWRDAKLNTDWRLITDQYYAVEYRKIMLSEVFASEGELVFVGRYLTEDNDRSYSWKLGAFKPDLGTGSLRVFASSISVTPRDGQVSVRNCRVLRNPSEGVLEFYIMFEDDLTGVYKGSLGD